MSWDDDDFDTPVVKDVPTVASWEEDDDDEALLESWDAEEAPKTTSAAKNTPKPKQASSGGKKKDAKSTDKVLLEIDTLDEKTRKELLKKAELDSDLNNAAELFAGLGVAEEHPRARALRKEQELDALSRPAALTRQTPIESHPLFSEAETKSDFQELRKSLSTAITCMAEKSQLHYTSALAVDLIRDIAKPLSMESIRQAVATLNVLIKDKERQERQARLAKLKGGTATGGAGKKKAKVARPNLGGAFKKDQDFSLDTPDFDDFGDNDFM